MTSVAYGWGIVRDIANSFFILILLWIALAIIFDLENLGGKKLLIRVIIIALLINFSLAITGAVFGFANTLAFPFKKNMPDDIAGFILDRVKLQTVLESPPSSASLSTLSTNISNAAASSDCILASLMADTSKSPQGCVSASATAAFFQTAANGFASGFSDGAIGLKLALSLGITNILLLVVIAAFAVMSVTLLQRIIAMMFLAILAPAAFLAFVVPGGKLTKLWDTWLQKLFCWAFILPAFYFLFYLSLLILMAMTGTDTVSNTGGFFFANLMRMIPLLIFLGFLVASLKIGKWLGCGGGDAVIGIGKTAAIAGLTYATGGATLAAGAIMRRPAMKEAVEGGMDKISRVPILGTAMRPVMRKTAEHYAGERKEVMERAKQYEHMSAPELGRMLRTAPEKWNAKDAAAAAYAASQKPELMKDLKPEEKERALRFASKFSLQEDILKTNPHLITDANAKQYVLGAENRADAIQKIVKRTEDKTKISKDAYADKDVLNAAWSNLKSPKELGRIMGETPDLAVAMIKRINEATTEEVARIKAELGSVKVERINNYLAGTQARRVWGEHQIRNQAWRNQAPQGNAGIAGGEGYVAV
ncbi:MAG: hypothetical protein HYT98_03825 [Candidatus Sungbacteria bacterium]|nr:hypothetical protein [Candidatus Sungbacteria bacterium]